jgi:hypothetical protein
VLTSAVTVGGTPCPAFSKRVRPRCRPSCLFQAVSHALLAANRKCSAAKSWQRRRTELGAGTPPLQHWIRGPTFRCDFEAGIQAPQPATPQWGSRLGGPFSSCKMAPKSGASFPGREPTPSLWRSWGEGLVFTRCVDKADGYRAALPARRLRRPLEHSLPHHARQRVSWTRDGCPGRAHRPAS